MKKLSTVLMALIMTFGLCACGEEAKKPTDSQASSSVVSDDAAKEVFAPSRTKTDLPNAKARNLNNTAYKLKKDKELNVVYIGGSITEGVGQSGTGNGWADLTDKWMKQEYPEAQINYFNEAIGGTGSYWGLFRAERDIIPANPDLVFIEFAINDTYQSFSKEQSTVTMEALIRKINTALPETDIVIVLTTDEMRIGQEYITLKAHKEAADFYGVPTINVGTALKAELDKTGKEWKDYFGDIVHPNDDGHKLYADTVISELKKLLPDSPSKVAEHQLSKETYLSNGIMKTTTITAEEIYADDKWALKKSNAISGIMEYKKGLRAQEKGAALTVTFEGATFGFGAEVKRGASVKVTIDGKEKLLVAEKDASNEVERYIFDNLAEGKHTVTIEYLGTAMFNIGAIFIG